MPIATIRRLLMRFLAFFRARREDDELNRELAAHLALLEDRFAEKGMSAAQARAAARRAFGGQIEQVRLRHRDARSFRWLDEWWLDFKLGARMLRKYPGLSVVGGIAMTVSIAFGTTTFAFFYSYLYPTLPLPDGNRIIALENWNVALNNESRQAAYDFFVWKEELKTVEQVGAFRNVGRNLIVPGGAVEPVVLAEITAGGLAAARVAPLIGRSILPEDERSGADPVLVIGHDVWQTRFAGDRSILGRQVRLGSTPHTIVGVMPEGFAFPVSHSYWAPLRLERWRDTPGDGPAIFIFGRLVPGVAMKEAQAELAPIGLRHAAAYPKTHAQLRPQVLPYTYPIVDIQDVSVWQVGVMQTTVSMLLVIVAVNVAILIYARTATRQGEIAIRTALGAGRARIVMQLFVEALVLCGVAAAGGVVLARVALSQGHAIMQAELGRMPFWMDLGIPTPTLLYVLGITIVAALLAGVVPALQATRYRLDPALRTLGGSTGMRLGTTWTILVVVQVAIAVAGLPAAVATGWREVRQATSAPAFAVEEYVGVQFASQEEERAPGVDPAAQRRESAARLATLQRELAAQIESEPWAIDVSMATAVPGGEPLAQIELEEVSPLAGPGPYDVKTNHVALDFFAAFDARMLAGRSFAAGDEAAVIVNRTFADRLFAGANALGRRIRYASPEQSRPGIAQASPWHEIVGVVDDLYTNAVSPEIADAVVFHPLHPARPMTASLIVRVRGSDPVMHASRTREIAATLDPDTRISSIPLAQIYRQDKLALRLVALVLGGIVLSVLLLSAAGIYALMSFTVARRRKEIGIRAALGANPVRLLSSIFMRAATQLTVGLILGVAGVAFLDWASDGGLLGGRQAILLPGVSLMMLLTGLVAAVGPARRGLRIQPTEALREE